MVVKCNFFADDTYLVFQDDNSRLLSSWFVYKKLRIYFGVDKTKSIVYASKRKIKKVSKLDIIYNNI